MVKKTLLAIIAIFCVDTVINDELDRGLATGFAAIIKSAEPAAVEPASLLSKRTRVLTNGRSDKAQNT
jgi:hypothetical protein